MSEQCTPQKKKECFKGSGQLLELMCSTCEAREPYEPSRWFQHIWFLFSLQKAGYPFEKNDLNLDEWIDIGVLSAEVEAIRWQMKQK